MSDESAAGASVEFSRTTAFVVSRPIARGAGQRVRDGLAEARPSDKSGTGWLLPGDDVVTVSLFLVRGDGVGGEYDTERDSESASGRGRRSEDALVWYVEVEDVGAWADPAAELARRTPLYDAFEESLVGVPRLYGESERMVHASNPARPERPETADVVLVRVGIEPGLPTWLARVVAGLIDLLEGTWVGRKLESSSGEVIEADDMDRVMDVYHTTDNAVARWSEVLLDFLFERAMDALGDPMDASEYELLVHETNPARR